MKFGIVGLGRMGANIAYHAHLKGHHPVVYNRSPGKVQALAAKGLEGAASIDDLVDRLPAPRIIFLYVPHGEATETICRRLRPLLGTDDIVGDCGNSHWADSRARHDLFAQGGIHFLDVGTSGGVQGAREGASFMVGGSAEAFDVVLPILRDLAVDDEAVYYVGPSGAGHFAKLVHNAIEFGMVQAIAEGVELLMRSDYSIDLPALFTSWGHGTVIRGWLVGLMAEALQVHGDFEELSTYVEDTGEVKWILDWALGGDIPTPVVTAAQTALMQYRDVDAPAAKAVALLRNQFGGHPVHRGRKKESTRSTR